jgi:RNA polymerase sigma-70 factor (ECF subfamily)
VIRAISSSAALLCVFAPLREYISLSFGSVYSGPRFIRAHPWLLSCLLIAAITSGAAHADDAKTPPGLRVFYTGHSFHMFVPPQVDQIVKAGAHPSYNLTSDTISDAMFKHANPEQLNWCAPTDMQMIKQADTISEIELIDRIIKGENELFEILIRRNNPYLYKLGMSYGYKHEDVEDLMQEAFIAAYLSLEKFEARSSFKTWITRIMLNQCYQKAKKLSFKFEKANDILNEKTTPMFESNRSTDTYRAVLNNELSNVIVGALTSIPLEYRMVFSLRELNGMSTAETAEALDISETNVKVRLNRAKHMLREKVEKMYTPEDIFEFNLIYCDKIVNEVMKAINKL